MAAASKKDFADLLIDKKFLTEGEYKQLRLKFQDDLFTIVAYLAGKHPNRKQELGRFWGDYIGIVYLDLSRTLIKYELLDKLPEEFVRQNLVMPVYEFGGTITVACARPEQDEIIHQVESHLDAFISPAFAFPDQIQAAIEMAYQTESSLSKLLEKTKITDIQVSDAPISVEELRKMSGEQAIVDFARGVMVLAVKQGASDIHIEPGELEARVRFRVDGVLQEIFQLEKALIPAINSRLKVMSGVNIAETRKPQDGAIKLKLVERNIDCRLSTIPTIYGEKIVLRLLGSGGFDSIPGIEMLEFSSRNERMVRQALANPHGIFFVTGPTGSGKTTTLYSMLHHINSVNVNIMTIEDPVEYRLPGLNQIQVNRAADVTFGAALRAALRQDPDTILVGEIRDLETATIATRAALTGHLVLTTLHTNSAVQAVTRLLDIGVEPFLVAPSIIGILAQRLVRRLCSKCKQKYVLTPQERDRHFKYEGNPEVAFYAAKGCERCNNIGYIGRLAIHELIMIDDDIRALIGQQAPVHEIRKWAEAGHMQSLRYDGMKKVLRGLTTIEELDRVTVLD